MGNIVGLDLSLCATGIIVINDKGDILEKKLIVSTPKEENTPRLLKICLTVMDVVNRSKPDLVVLEGPAFGVSKTISIFQLGELAGMTKEKLFIQNIPFRIVPPTVLKKFITGKGNATKDIVMLKIYKKYGIEFEDNNLADAYALARYGIQFINPSLKQRRKFNDGENK
jgi:crossover junction endodeoxyribonuclease RuvC